MIELMTIGTLAGLMIPMVEDAAVTVPQNMGPNPRLVTGRIRIPPTAAVPVIKVSLMPVKKSRHGRRRVESSQLEFR